MTAVMGPSSATPGGAEQPDGSRHTRDTAAPSRRFRAVTGYLSTLTVSTGIASEFVIFFFLYSSIALLNRVSTLKISKLIL